MKTGIMNEEGDNEAREDIQPAAIFLIEGSVSGTYTMTEERRRKEQIEGEGKRLGRRTIKLLVSDL